MKEYQRFISQLQSGVDYFISHPKDNWKALAAKYLDGFAADELRKLIDLKTRRQYGAFFTDSSLANRVLTEFRPKLTTESIIYDPACGAGNLLLSVVDFIQRLNINFDFENKILGTDIHQEFVDAAKLRLIIKQYLISPGQLVKCNKEKLNYNIITRDGLQKNSFYEKATHIFVNPPFNLMTPDESLDWTNGKVSAAAVFIDKIVQHVHPGTSIIAILPDVLRSGSRYENWRTKIKNECVFGKVKLLGQFDKYTDVDVFAVELVKKQIVTKKIKYKNEAKDRSNKKTIEELFDVCVGTVVDNRDPHNGQLLEYIISRGLKPWDEIKNVDLKRKHTGKNFQGPFVVVKRTSRMGDSHRATGTIINIPSPVFVDNHLIVLKPKSGKLSDCKKALISLKDKRTDIWINNKIRCRHLTVKVVSKIPIWQ